MGRIPPWMGCDNRLQGCWNPCACLVGSFTIQQLPMFPNNLKTMPLKRHREPFSHPDWLYELKHDGYRALAFVRDGTCRLVSRNGNDFKSFTQLAAAIPKVLRGSSAVLDGEIVCLDEQGRSQFNELLFRRGEPRF